jgi:hypothetical protein
MNTREVYVRVLHIVEFFLKNAMHLSIADLQNHDPSIEELAKDVRKLSFVLRILVEDCEDENMAINALQCCIEMERLARAVRSGNESDLEGIFRNLEMYIKVP